MAEAHRSILRLSRWPLISCLSVAVVCLASFDRAPSAAGSAQEESLPRGPLTLEELVAPETSWNEEELDRRVATAPAEATRALLYGCIGLRTGRHGEDWRRRLDLLAGALERWGMGSWPRGVVERLSSPETTEAGQLAQAWRDLEAGWTLARQGRFERALDPIISGAGIAQRLDHPWLGAVAGYREGFVMDVVGKLRGDRDLRGQALVSLRRAAAACRAVGDPYMLGILLDNIGGAELDADQSLRARHTWEEGISVCERSGDYSTSAHLSQKMANALRRNGLFEQAWRPLDRAWGLVEAHPAHDWAQEENGAFLLAIGQERLRNAEATRSLVALEEAVVDFAEIADALDWPIGDSRREIELDYFEGILDGWRGRWDLARAHFERVLRAEPGNDLGPYTLELVARAHHQRVAAALQDPDFIERHFDEVPGLLDELVNSPGRDQGNIAITLWRELGQYQRALDFIEPRLERARGKQDQRNTAWWLSERALVEFDAARNEWARTGSDHEPSLLKQAEASNLEAIQGVEELFRTRREDRDELGASIDFDAAYELAARVSALRLERAVSSKEAFIQGEQLVQAADRANHGILLDRLTTRALGLRGGSGFEGGLLAEHDRGNVSVPVRGWRPETEHVVIWISGPTQLRIVHRRPDGAVHTEAVVWDRDLEARLISLRAHLARTKPDDDPTLYLRALEKLSQDLLATYLEGWIEEGEPVVLVASGELALFPLELLLLDETTSSSWSGVPFWALRNPLRRAPTLEALDGLAVRESSRRSPAGQLVGVGAVDADLGRSPARPPRGAYRILLDAKAAYGDGSKLIAGVASTVGALKRAASRGAQTLVIAAHARYDRVRGEASLTLAGPDAARELLYARQISRLEWPATFAVLAACESAVAHSFPGDVPESLAQAVLHAGAASTLAGLWPLPEEPTADFLSVFWRQKAGRVSERLSAARRVFIEAGRPPSEWAGLVHTGIDPELELGD